MALAHDNPRHDFKKTIDMKPRLLKQPTSLEDLDVFGKDFFVFWGDFINYFGFEVFGEMILEYFR